MTDSYATPARLAIYLEIGWSDFLLHAQDSGGRADRLPYPNPMRDCVPPEFPRQVAALARAWADQAGAGVKSFCDVGGATGRAVFEIDQRFEGLERLTLVEPSKIFCDWADRLLASDAALPEIPVIDRAGAPRRVTPSGRPPSLPDAGARLRIVNSLLEDYQPDDRVDLVACLNVVDRHPRPQALIETLAALINEGGLLVLSSPFDFRLDATPDRESWIDDLNDLFAGDERWESVGDEEVYYEFRASRRKWIRFSSQVVCKRRRG